MGAAYENLLDGNITQAVNLTYVGVMGYWWVFLLLFGILISLYIKTKNIALLFAGTFLGTASLLPFLPLIFHPVLYLIMALSLGMVLYKVFGKSDDQ